MDGIGIPHERMLGGIEHDLSLPNQQRPPRIPSIFLQRNLNDEALRQPPATVFDGTDLERARQDGYAAGRTAGLSDGDAARETAEAAALGTLTGLLADATAASAAAADRAGAALARALLGALGAVMPDLIERTALAEAGAMLSVVLQGLSREPAVTVDVPPEIQAGVAALVARIKPELSDRVRVQAQCQLAPGEVRVRWSAGHARRDPAAVWTMVMERLEPALSPAATVSKTEDTDGE